MILNITSRLESLVEGLDELSRGLSALKDEPSGPICSRRDVRMNFEREAYLLDLGQQCQDVLVFLDILEGFNRFHLGLNALGALGPDDGKNTLLYLRH